MDADYDVDFVGSEVAGQDILPPIDPDNEGHPGFEANQIRDEVFDWLQINPADIILLHIGTNNISGSQTVAEIIEEVKEILDDIFAYSPEITVVLAKIINRKSFSQKTNDFNNLLPGMVNIHPNKDKVIIVDMEVGAGIDYDTDMIDDLHPNENGYSKMADVWFDALEQILPVADFAGDPISGVHPLTVNFTDESTGTIDTWEWNFGDDSPLSNAQNPNHTYENPGTYTVELTVTGSGGTDKETKTDYIIVEHVANFTADNTSGVAPLTVNFTDESTGEITDLSWDFGDGLGYSTQQNPSYAYNGLGTYTVSLTVTGPGGTDTLIKTDYITVSNSTDGGGGGGGGGGCFISTATHGLYMDTHVKVPHKSSVNTPCSPILWTGRSVDLYHTVLRYFSTSHPFSLSLSTRTWCSNQKGLSKEEDLNPE
jgi:PKD repeat protein